MIDDWASAAVECAAERQAMSWSRRFNRKSTIINRQSMSHSLRTALTRLLDGEDLSAAEMCAAVGDVMSGEASEAAVAALLTALRMKGETVEEIAGAARAMIRHATRIEVGRHGLLDTCGTGGDRLHTFNISTATALVAAAAGAPVAKHGNRSVSSRSGSADVLEALGVNINLAPRQVAGCIEQAGIGFCFAPLVHGAMKHAAAVRRQLGFRSIFNLLGPLTNPAGAEYQLVGAGDVQTAEKLAGALVRLLRRRAVVVCGAGGLDEVSLWGETTAFVVEAGGLEGHQWSPETFGLPACGAQDLQVDSPQQSAAVIRGVLAGESGPARDIVLANTAAALFAAERAADLPAGVESAARAIDSGAAAETLERLIELSNSDQ